jgi:hypothetical protein
MSVIPTLRVHGDPKELERRAAANPDAIRAIGDRAKESEPEVTFWRKLESHDEVGSDA